MSYHGPVDRALSRPLWSPQGIASPRVGFTRMQWSIILDAPRDPLASLRPAGRIRRALGLLFGDTVDPGLANPHLEALRRAALLTWHHGFKLPADELSEFLAAGFNLQQFDLMVEALRSAIGPRRKFA